MLERAGEGEIFAETYASIPDQKMLVNVIAAEDTEILLWEKCSTFVPIPAFSIMNS